MGSSISFDEKFKAIPNLKWLPWIGERYERTGTMILGESQYENGDDWQEDNINATRGLIDGRFQDKIKYDIYGKTERVVTGIEKAYIKSIAICMGICSLFKSSTAINVFQRRETNL